MYYDPRENLKPLPLKHNPFNALVAPRPIGWISTINASGAHNLAPFSYFNGVCADPPCVMFAPNARDVQGTAKDTYANLIDVPEFVVNLATHALREAVVLTSRDHPPGDSEFELANLTPIASRQVRPPRVKESPAAMECRVLQALELPKGLEGRVAHVVIGEVVGIHIDDELITDGVVREDRIGFLARLGGINYCEAKDLFKIPRPE